MLAALLPAMAAAPATASADPLTLVAQSDRHAWNGVVVAPDGRVLVEMPRIANPGQPLSLAVLDAAGGLTPYPDAGWNAPPKPGGPAPVAGDSFVGLNAIRLAPDGSLWAVDTGVPGYGRAPVPGGARLIRIDLAGNRVTRILAVPAEALRPKSMLDDIRFNGDHAYVTDAGAPGLLVLDLRSGLIRRVLDRAPGLTAQRPIMVDGSMLKGPDGRPVLLHADQMEVSPDGRTLFVQPLCGPMSRIDTALLDDPRASPQVLAAGLEFWFDTPSLGGTAIAPDGTLYLNDIETDTILSLSPDRVLTRLLHDPRLHWADAPFLGADGTLTVPVPQLDRAAPFHHGRDQIRWPVALYRLRPSDLAAGAPGGG